MEITKVPHEVLTKKALEVPIEEIKAGEHARLISDMKKAMFEHEGVGLAANQIGKDLAVFVIDIKTADAYKVPEAYFNPEITEYSPETELMEEGCLSIPGYYFEIKRSKKVMLKAVNEHGEKIKIKARGFLARVFQHETDHLNGKTIKDRANG
ncbi:MAG: peptide deformylase [Candidatus Yanofskybacteria bacterium RIFCSPHIGHO2_02_FULL_50_12]|uniref:Peptide deformylase n=1 Tax=Candidatus Yanofskybacteria bacterium RIFCSPHIGHO2_02_FULL_50_12 TaxID=1802685 RepID=A0A1F8FVL8_9BACT|nr:MAG: peptide deformylase [Candidatus Yanofskybacteria bacterium RIFCSPHIGHO2_02_FULL_50_12]